MEIPKKNKIKIIITLVIVVLLIAILIIFKDKFFVVQNNITDSEKFYTEYNQVGVDNIFEYVSAKQAIELFKSEKAIIFFGFKECKWCQSYAPILNEAAKENGADKIYYCNIKEDRKENTSEYQELVKLLEKYLYEDDNKNKRIYVPDVYFVKDKKIIGHNNDTSIIEGADTEEYYTAEQKKILKDKLVKLVKSVYDNKDECNDSKKGC